jgi:hypothetical protein
VIEVAPPGAAYRSKLTLFFDSGEPPASNRANQ